MRKGSRILALNIVQRRLRSTPPRRLHQTHTQRRLLLEGSNVRRTALLPTLQALKTGETHNLKLNKRAQMYTHTLQRLPTLQLTHGGPSQDLVLTCSCRP